MIAMKISIYKYHYLFLSALVALSAGCSTDNGDEPENPADEEILRISVNAPDLSMTRSEGSALPDYSGRTKEKLDTVCSEISDATRATNNNQSITFEKGDAIGVTYFRADGTVTRDNVKFTYDGSQWICDNSVRGTGAATRYVAYFPYNATMSDVTAEAAVETKAPFSWTQDTKAAYQANDVMAGSGAASTNITVTLRHLRGCISVNVFAAGGKFYYQYKGGSLVPDVYQKGGDKVTYTVNGKSYNAYNAEDGTARLIVRPNDAYKVTANIYKSSTLVKSFEVKGADAKVSAGNIWKYTVINGTEYSKNDALNSSYWDYFNIQLWKESNNKFHFVPKGKEPFPEKNDDGTVKKPAGALHYGYVFKTGKDKNGNYVEALFIVNKECPGGYDADRQYDAFGCTHHKSRIPHGTRFWTGVYSPQDWGARTEEILSCAWAECSQIAKPWITKVRSTYVSVSGSGINMGTWRIPNPIECFEIVSNTGGEMLIPDFMETKEGYARDTSVYGYNTRCPSTCQTTYLINTIK